MPNLKQIKLIPKIDLHRHLEGSIRPETIYDLSKKYGGEYTQDELTTLMKVDGSEKTLMDFIYKLGTPFMLQHTKDKDDMKRFAYEACADAHKDGVMYLELRCCPSNYFKTPLKAEEFFEAVHEGMQQAEEKFQMKTGLIISIKREEDPKINNEIIDIAVDYFYDKKVVGMDLCGNEPQYPTRNYKKIFERFSRLGIPITVHAGESGDEKLTESIEDAIKLLHAQRIGHGTIARVSNKTMKLIKDNNILIETCPTSNIHTRIVKDLSEQPASRFFNKNLEVSVNTDDPVTSDITLSSEFLNLMEMQGFEIENFKQIGLKSIQHAFQPDEEKESLKNKFLDKFHLWEFDNLGTMPQRVEYF